MKVNDLFETTFYDRHYADGMPETVLADVCRNISTVIGINFTDVRFLGPGLGTRLKLPGWIEITCRAEDEYLWELACQLLPATIKKAFKVHLGLDVRVKRELGYSVSAYFDVQLA